MATFNTISMNSAAIRPPPGLSAPCQSAYEAPQTDAFNVVLRKAARGKLGISVAAVPALGLKTAAGLMVTEIIAGGAADLHNTTCSVTKMISPGDIIVSVNGVALNADLLHRALADIATSASEQFVEVCFLRQPLKPSAAAAPSQMTPAKPLLASALDRCAARKTTWSDVSTDASSTRSPQTSSPCSSQGNLPPYQPACAPLPRKLAVATAAAATPKKKSQKPEAKSEPKTEEKPLEKPTTLVLGQLPITFSRKQLEALLDQKGFATLYDFTYVPRNLRTNKPFRYGFVNLVDGDVAVACKDALDGYVFEPETEGGVPEVMTTEWASSKQGLQASIMRYRDSPLMHESVHDEAKPALFVRGVRVDFPPPTKVLKALPQKLSPMAPPGIENVPATRLC